MAHEREPSGRTITDFITQDLKQRIQADRRLPAKLTLTDLAEYYRVSLTPVRLAVHALLQEQVLIKQTNGRLLVNREKVAGEARPESPEELPQPASPQDWEAILTESILQQSLRGGGQYLREEGMAQQHGIGRTLLRQVFHRLAGKGLLEHIPRRGWRVRTFDEEDMSAYLIMRETLELTALDLARPHLVAADLERMLQGNAPGSQETPARLDNDLHRYLVEKAGNAYIADFFARNGLYYTTLFDFAAPEAHVMNEMAEQHRAILTALLQKDWKQAREALRRHIRAQRPIVKRLMEQAARASI